ncbi:MAG: hypothetical protein H3C54_09515 [Taibaiella sp.]|nr:hypothetical protein [Taibaiella sp.]
MKNFQVVNIIKVALGSTLLELHINIRNQGEKKALVLSINDDGESISVVEKIGWTNLADLHNETYSYTTINDKSNTNDELSKLLNSTIIDLQYGIGNELGTKLTVVYYVQIQTNICKFLFFNNGDDGQYTFDKIEDFLANDIYGFKWTHAVPKFTP